jgi:hypothetical protein
MGRQLNIRSDQAYELATRIAARRETSITDAVLLALTELDARDESHARETREEKRARWNQLLEEGWKQLNDSDFRIEDLYDPETGLPA